MEFEGTILNAGTLFAIRFNGLLIEFLTSQELYLFGLGLHVAAEVLPIQLVGKTPDKSVN